MSYNVYSINSLGGTAPEVNDIPLASVLGVFLVIDGICNNAVGEAE